MARPGISQQQVAQAAQALHDEGITPTVQAVRERLGSGSYSTITTHLSTWKKQHQAQQVPDVPEIPEAVANGMRQLWALAWKESRDATQAERDALETARERFNHERAEMAQEISRLEHVVEDLEQQRDALTKDVAALTQQWEKNKEDNQKLTLKMATLEEQAAGLQRENERLAKALDGQTSEYSAFTQRVTALENELQSMRKGTKEKE